MAPPPNVKDPSQVSHRASVRIVVAVVLLVTAVTILAILNKRKITIEEPGTEPQVQESISSTQIESVTPPATELNSISSPPPLAEVSGPSEAPAPQTPSQAAPAPTAPSTPPPPPPVVGRLPVLQESPAKPTTAKPSTDEKPTMAKALAEAKGGKTPMEKLAPEIKPSVAPPPPPPTPAATATSTPSKPPAPGKPPASSRQTPPAPAPKSLDVQVGVFSDPENAKQLQAKLAEHGIPSHMETHLQIGPFKDRAEADAAREKLKALGISGVIVPNR